MKKNFWQQVWKFITKSVTLWFWILTPPDIAVCTLLVCIWRRPTPSKQTNFHAYRHLQNLLGFTSNAEKDNLELSASHQKYCGEQILHQLNKSNISKCQKHDLLRGQCWMQTQFTPPRAINSIFWTCCVTLKLLRRPKTNKLSQSICHLPPQLGDYIDIMTFLED